MALFPPQQRHGGKTPRNSSLRNSSSIKSGIFLYSSETVFFYKIFQKCVVFGHFGLKICTIIFWSTPFANHSSSEDKFFKPISSFALDWLCDVCGCVMSPTSGIYWVNPGFINNYKEPQLWLVFLRYSADVASAFPWVVTYGIRVGSVTPFGLRDTIPQSGP